MKKLAALIVGLTLFWTTGDAKMANYIDEFTGGVIDTVRWSVLTSPIGSVVQSGGFLEMKAQTEGSAGGVFDKTNRTRATEFSYEVDIKAISFQTNDFQAALAFKQRATIPPLQTTGNNADQMVIFIGFRRTTTANHGITFYYIDNNGQAKEWNGSEWENAVSLQDLGREAIQDEDAIVHGTIVNFKFISTPTKWKIEARVTGGNDHFPDAVDWASTRNLSDNPFWFHMGDTHTIDLRGEYHADRVKFDDDIGDVFGAGYSKESKPGNPITKAEVIAIREQARIAGAKIRVKFDQRTRR